MTTAIMFFFLGIFFDSSTQVSQKAYITILITAMIAFKLPYKVLIYTDPKKYDSIFWNDWINKDSVYYSLIY
jgi:hypothetical protein